MHIFNTVTWESQLQQVRCGIFCMQSISSDLASDLEEVRIQKEKNWKIDASKQMQWIGVQDNDEAMEINL